MSFLLTVAYIYVIMYMGEYIVTYNEALYAFAYLRMRHAPTPVGRTVPGAPLRWTAEHLPYMSIPALLIHPVRGGVLDAPRAG